MAAVAVGERVWRLEHPALHVRLEQMRVRDAERASGFGELLNGPRGEGGQGQRYRDTPPPVELRLHLADFRSDGG